MLTSLDDLVLKCRSQKAKRYIQEAISCYNATAYKSAIVVTWIAVVYDIYEKIHDLSMNGDSKAREEFNKIENWQTQLQNGNENVIKCLLGYERDILDLAHNTFEFIDLYQYEDLKRLQEDRHKCAHPTFQKDWIPFNPSAELVRVHIYNAVEFLLSQPPLQGKSALQVINNVLTSDFLPLETKQIKEALMATPFAKPSSSLIKALVGELVYDIFESNIYKKRQFRILSVVSLLYPIDTLAEIIKILPKLYPQIQTNDKFYLFVGLVTRISNLNLWPNIPQAYRDSIRKFITEGDAVQVAWALSEAPKIKELEFVIWQYIYSVDVKDLVKIFTSPFVTKSLFELFKEHIISLYTKVDHWETNNIIVRNLLHPFFSSLTKTDINNIKKFVLEDSNIKESTSLPLLIRDIYEYGCNNSIEEKHKFDSELVQNELSKMVITDEQFDDLIIPF